MAIPAAYASDVLDRLRAAFLPLADPAVAEGMSRYMRGQFPFLGIASGPRGIATRATFAGLRPPDQAAIEAAIERLWAQPEREYQYAGAELAARNLGMCDASFIDCLGYAIANKSWWDTVDGLAADAVGRLVTQHPGLQETMNAWLAGENLWLTRSAILHQLRYRERTDETWLLNACLSRASDRDFFVRKAIGWALREYSKTEPLAVVAFVTANAAALSPLSRREALKWLAIRETGRARAAALELGDAIAEAARAAPLSAPVRG